jgi:hypothetical protein
LKNNYLPFTTKKLSISVGRKESSREQNNVQEAHVRVLNKIKMGHQILFTVFTFCSLCIVFSSQHHDPEDRWVLYKKYGDPTNPLYNGDDADELLDICGGVKNCESGELAAKHCTSGKKVARSVLQYLK